MKSIKYLFKRGFRPIRTSILSVFAVAMPVLVMVFHENAASEDYLISKIALNFGTMVMHMALVMLLCTETTGNRLIRSAPISKELRTFGIPMFNIILGVSAAAVTLLPYTIFIFASGLPLSHLSDTMIVTAVMIFFFIILGTVALHLRYGMVLLIYAYIPVCGLMFFLSDDQWNNGFGMELWLSAVISGALIAAAMATAFIISRLFYKHSDFKAYQQTLSST